MFRETCDFKKIIFQIIIPEDMVVLDFQWHFLEDVMQN